MLIPFLRVSCPYNQLRCSTLQSLSLSLTVCVLCGLNQPSGSLFHPCLEHVTRLDLSTLYEKDDVKPYPAVLLPNVTHLNLSLGCSLEGFRDAFVPLVNILPGMNPTYLCLLFLSNCYDY